MDLTINGKPLASLRVVDLKEELQKRGLPKSGNKTELIERLKGYLAKQQIQPQHQNANDLHQSGTGHDTGVGGGAQPPNVSLAHGLTDNDFVKDYLKLREAQFASALSDQDVSLQDGGVGGAGPEIQHNLGHDHMVELMQPQQPFQETQQNAPLSAAPPSEGNASQKPASVFQAEQKLEADVTANRTPTSIGNVDNIIAVTKGRWKFGHVQMLACKKITILSEYSSSNYIC